MSEAKGPRAIVEEREILAHSMEEHATEALALAHARVVQAARSALIALEDDDADASVVRIAAKILRDGMGE